MSVGNDGLKGVEKVEEERDEWEGEDKAVQKVADKNDNADKELCEDLLDFFYQLGA